MHRAWACLLLALLWPVATLAADRGAIVVKDDQGRELLSYGGSYALVIGVSDYQLGWPKLPGVKDDVAAVQSALEQHGFEVTAVEDPSGQELETAYRDFIFNYGRDESNRVLLYFAGHGHTDKPPWADDPEEWMGYIVARDAPLPTDDSTGVLQKALSMQRFEELAKQIHARHALFVFDSCFSGSVFALKLRAPPADIERRSRKPVRQFITSGAADQTVPDVSVFRKQFILALDGAADLSGDGYITGTELGYYLEERVSNYTDNAQTPQYGKIRDPHLDKGDFVFEAPGATRPQGPPVTPALPPVTPAPPPTPVKFVGNLQVNVSALSTVYLNDQRLGEAGPNRPLNQTGMPLGRARVRVEAKGYLTATRTAEIKSGQWTQLVFELEREKPLAAHLTVRSNVSDDTLYINDEPKGPTGPRVLDLAPGEYLLRVEKAGYDDWEHHIVVNAGEERTLRAWLRRPPEREPQLATLTLRSNVVEDRVFVDDRPRGSTPLDLELEPGPHRVVVEKEGYIPFEEPIELSPGQRLTLRAELLLPGLDLGRVEELLGAWMQNRTHRNAEALLSLASLPFLFYDEIAHNEEQFLEILQERLHRPDFPESATILHMETLQMSAAEIERLNPQLAEAAPLLGADNELFRLTVTHDRAREAQVVMIVRPTDRGLKLAGFCCAEVVQR